MVSPPIPNERQLGQAVRELREERGITGERLAREAEVDVAHLNRAENHGRNFTLQTLIALAGVLGVRPSDLVERAEAIAQRDMRNRDEEDD
jgi:transcriptional regulator with XRE-family HTH domain